jgi:hypothetical protein
MVIGFSFVAPPVLIFVVVGLRTATGPPGRPGRTVTSVIRAIPERRISAAFCYLRRLIKQQDIVIVDVATTTTAALVSDSVVGVLRQ